MLIINQFHFDYAVDNHDYHELYKLLLILLNY